MQLSVLVFRFQGLWLLPTRGVTQQRHPVASEKGSDEVNRIKPQACLGWFPHCKSQEGFLSVDKLVLTDLKANCSASDRWRSCSKITFERFFKNNSFFKKMNFGGRGGQQMHIYISWNQFFNCLAHQIRQSEPQWAACCFVRVPAENTKPTPWQDTHSTSYNSLHPSWCSLQSGRKLGCLCSVRIISHRSNAS